MASVPRIILLHPIKPQFKIGFCTPVIHWYQNLAMQGKIELAVVGPTAELGKGISHPPLDAVDPSKFDGIVAVAIVNEPFLADVATRGLPTIVLDHQPLPTTAIDSVAFNNTASAENLGRRVTNLGHRDALYVTRFLREWEASSDPAFEAVSSCERRNGLTQAFDGTQTNMWGLFPWNTFGTAVTPDARDDARRHMEKMFATAGKHPDCIITVDYAVAEEIHALLLERGLSVPKDVSLATFQLHPYSEEHPQKIHISHMRYDYLQMAAEGWRLLSGRLSSDAARAAPPQAVKIGSTFFDCGTLADRRAV